MDIGTVPFKPKGETIPWATTGWKPRVVHGVDLSANETHLRISCSPGGIDTDTV